MQTKGLTERNPLDVAFGISDIDSAEAHDNDYLASSVSNGVINLHMGKNVCYHSKSGSQHGWIVMFFTREIHF